MIKDESYQDVTTIDSNYISDYETKRNKPMPSFNHAAIQHRISGLLFVHYENEFTIGSEIDLDLPESKKPTVPDIAIFKKRKVDLSNDILKMKDAPITTIEILSPKQDLDSLKEKIFNNYFPAGVQSAWIVVPTTRTITIYIPNGKFTSYASGKFTDPATNITLDVDAIFKDM